MRICKFDCGQVLCGNYVNGGLDANTPVDTCNIYLTGPGITAEYNSLRGSSSKRHLLQNTGNGCNACLENCACGNSVNSGNGNGVS